MKYKILVVDDEPANLRMIERLFRDDHEVLTAASGLEGLELLSHHDIALIVSDQRMPGMTGIDFLKKAAEMRPQTVRIILTGYTDVKDLVDAINSGVVYRYITKPWVNTDLRQSVQRAIEHYETVKMQTLLAIDNERLEIKVTTTVQAFVSAIREMIAQKNSNLAEHCRRTSNYAALIGEQLHLGPNEMENLIFAALLHEVPNMRLPFEMHMNKTALTAEQYRVTRNNYENGLRMIESVPDLLDVANIIRYQHEHYDGSGFFDGLDGDKIILSSRILSVANAFDEINSGRNPALFCTDEEAAEWLLRRAGSEFDPQVVDICLRTKMVEQTGVPIAGRSNEQDSVTIAASL